MTLVCCLSDWPRQLRAGGAEDAAGTEGEGAADDEGRSRGAQLTQTAELPTAKQRAQTRHYFHSIYMENL